MSAHFAPAADRADAGRTSRNRRLALALAAGVALSASIAVCGTANAWNDVDPVGASHGPSIWGPDLAELNAAFWAPPPIDATLGVTEMNGAFTAAP